MFAYGHLKDRHALGDHDGTQGAAHLIAVEFPAITSAEPEPGGSLPLHTAASRLQGAAVYWQGTEPHCPSGVSRRLASPLKHSECP